ncbi:MAG: hypothetical protein QM784_34805 [Polyangiaceae bacterium]
MGRWGLAKVCGCLAALSSLVGCAEDVAEEGVARSSQAVVGVDEFLYLRCGATGWGADSATLLSASSTPGIYTLEYNVTAPHMVTGGDQCVVTRTNSRTGWGSASTSFGAATNTVVTAPGQWSIGAANSTPATVRYPALGRYRANVNFGAGTVAIEAVDSAPAVSSDYYYLRCNATGWGVASTNRLAPTSNSGLSLSYSVNQAWMVSGGDQCVVTRTNQLDGWGTVQATLGTSSSTTLVVPGTSSVSTTLVAPGQQFTVRYPAVGQYQARFNPTTGELRISVPGTDVPETGLHGAVESLGGNRVRISYDFQSAAQLQDFVSTDVTSTAVAIESGRLVVQNIASVATLNAAALIKGIKNRFREISSRARFGHAYRRLSRFGLGWHLESEARVRRRSAQRRTVDDGQWSIHLRRSGRGSSRSRSPRLHHHQRARVDVDSRR